VQRKPCTRCSDAPPTLSALTLTAQDFLSPDNPELELACGHKYHLPCLLAWEQRSHLCPVCNARMVHDALG
jgi:hypothetical protein